MKPDITVIAPVYNVEDYVEKSVQSICNQTLKNIEIILVDDGATDGSPEILDDMAKSDHRIQVIHQVNAGAAAARNNGVQNAHGKYLYFLDPDDWLEKDMLQNMFEFAETNQLQLVITGFVNEYYENGQYFSVQNKMPRAVYAESKSFRKNAHKYLNNTFLAVPWNKLYLTDYIKNNSIQFPSVKWDDLYFNMEVIRDVNKVGVLNIAKYHFFRSRPGSETTKVFNDSLFGARKTQFEHILSVYQSWGVKDHSILSEVYYYYALRIIQLIQEISNQGSLSLQRKSGYVREILADSLTQRAFKKGTKNKLKLKILFAPYVNKLTFVTLFCGNVISFGKNHFAQLFYRLRMNIQSQKE